MPADAPSGRPTPQELKERIAAERRGDPFLVLRDGAGAQMIVELGAGVDRIAVGRAPASDLCIDWDDQASRLHAELERMGDDWTVADDGLSRNGTWLNADRVTGRRRLSDGDVLRFGRTTAEFRAPAPAVSGLDVGETAVAPDVPDAASLSPTQRKVLVALCRPFRDATGYATPATNREVAEELFLSVDAVKTHLRTLFAKFEIGDLPQNQKRVRLVELALRSGLVSLRDL